MYANSRQIFSAQTGPHDKLPALIARHVQSPFLRPIADHALAAFAQFESCWDGRSPLLLDAGCGVGWSSLQLAQQYPDHCVIAVDQSEDRIARGKPVDGELPPNLIFLRTDLTDFWRVLQAERIRLARHYLLYPNPWPKIGHLSRRWHGSAVFPSVLALGGVLECRSNWRIYVEEMAIAIGLIHGAAPVCELWQADQPLTPFERKYRDSGHALYRLQIDLNQGLSTT